jgi:hypothetical protein
MEDENDNQTEPRVFVSSVKFSDGQQLSFSRSDVVVVVGPNNGGKSSLLRDIRVLVRHKPPRTFVVSEVKIDKQGSEDDLRSWLAPMQLGETSISPEDQHYDINGNSTTFKVLNACWQHHDKLPDPLRDAFFFLLSAEQRLNLSDPPRNIAITSQRPVHPIQALFLNDELEQKVSEKVFRAFGVDLVVHRNAGDAIPLHVGKRPSPNPGEDRISFGYVQRLQQLPTLQSQGDGMRSFVGVLLYTLLGQHTVVLIDEPEAFLHPPQAKLLGRSLVQNRFGKRQLFIATHSSDVLRGVLDSGSSDVKVIRIKRDGENNAVRLLDNDRVKQLWSDPLLRHSNILDGLFHDGVIVCESDGDCRFYAAVLDSLDRERESLLADIQFTHCGGKHRLPTVVNALKQVDVPVHVVADFDVLSAMEPLKSIVESLGVDWQTIQRDWELVKSSIEQRKPELETSEVKKEIDRILENVDQASFPKEAAEKIKAVLKKSSAWAQAKTIGRTFVPSGDATQACSRLLENLSAAGLFVVEVGELEGFVRSVGGHGPRWVNEVLALNLATDSKLDDARSFIRRVSNFAKHQT